MTQSRTPRSRTSGTSQPQGRTFPLLPVLGGLVAVALVATVILTFDSGSSGDQFGEVTVEGTTLGRFGGTTSSDPEVGAPIPAVTGEDFGGDQVVVADDGRAKMLLFLAHWCPVCQAEAPQVDAWLGAEGLPDGVDLYVIPTGTSSTRANYPPQTWLEREGLGDLPILVDDEDFTAADAFGLSAYPYWVFVGDDGRVLARVTGQIDSADLGRIASSLAP